MIHISGVLVRCRPENIEPVSQTLAALAGVEVHGANPDGRLVVTVEAHSDQGIADTVLNLQDQPGVIAASMIYHQFEDAGEDELAADAQTLQHDPLHDEAPAAGEASPTPMEAAPSSNSISQEAQS